MAPARGRFRFCGICGARLAFAEIGRAGASEEAQAHLFAAIQGHLQTSVGCENEAREETAYGVRLADEALAHAVDKHGMRRATCPSCAGRDAGCPRCGDDGKAWLFDLPTSCGPRCPLAVFEQGEPE